MGQVESAAAGTAASGHGGSGAAQELNAAFFTTLGRPDGKAQLSRISGDMMAGIGIPAAVSPRLAGVDPTTHPGLQPLLRAVTQADPGVTAALSSLVGHTPAHPFTTASQFWQAYLTRLLEVVSTPPGAPPASSPPPRATVTPPSAAASPFTSPPPEGEAPPLAVTVAASPPDDDDDGDATLLLSLPEVFCYRIPARPSASGHRAADWGLDTPLVTGYLRVTAVGEKEVAIVVWQKPAASGGGGGKAEPPQQHRTAENVTMAPAALGHKIVAACVIPFQPPGTPGGLWQQPLSYYCEPVVDSSRYYVLRGVAPRGGGSTFVGIGFRERQHAFDLKSAILDHAAFVDRQRGVGGRHGKEVEGGVEMVLPSLADGGVEVAEWVEDVPAPSASTTPTAGAPATSSSWALSPGERIRVAWNKETATSVGKVTHATGTSPFKLPPPRSANARALAATPPSHAGGVGNGDTTCTPPALPSTAGGGNVPPQGQVDDEGEGEEDWGEFTAVAAGSGDGEGGAGATT